MYGIFIFIINVLYYVVQLMSMITIVGFKSKKELFGEPTRYRFGLFLDQDNNNNDDNVNVEKEKMETEVNKDIYLLMVLILVITIK